MRAARVRIADSIGVIWLIRNIPGVTDKIVPAADASPARLRIECGEIDENTGASSSFRRIEVGQSIDSFVRLTLKYPQQETAASGRRYR
jgi:hypothetical protein